MKYEYYKWYDAIYRIKIPSSENEKMEWYCGGKWKMSITSSINIIENTNTKKITKEEAFMELL